MLSYAHHVDTIMAEPVPLSGLNKQKKNRKKKKRNVNLSATIVKSGKSSGNESLEAESTESGSRESNFDDELTWCIRQLELGLLRDKVTSSQRTESALLLKKLQSRRTPMPRKRQLMRVVFGDYRSTMKQSPLQSLPEKAEVKIESSKGPSLEDKGTFFRHKKEITTDRTETEFKFNFVV